MLTALIFIIVISILVFVHELGHFWTAKRAGMQVEEFGFGFPPRVCSWRRRPGADIEFAFGTKPPGSNLDTDTVYSINWIPFGGFVKITGEDGAERDNPRSFAAKPTGVRALVIVAGVVMNLLLAVLLLILGNGIGLRTGLDDQLAMRAREIKLQIVQVEPNSPAQAAGLQVFDELTGFQTVPEFQQYIASHKGRAITLAVRRVDQPITVTVTPRLNPPAGQGALGVSLALTGIVRYHWPEAIKKGFQDTYYITRETIIGYATVIKNIFSKGRPGVELSGPIGIAVVTGQAVRLGWAYLIQLVALISINLAVLNIIPFPALDGGRLLFIIIEKLKGSPIPKRIEGLVNAVGFALLILLMIYVTTKDVLKFF